MLLCAVDMAGGYSSRSLTVSTESWIGHPMDPIGCLFSVLLDAADGTSVENKTGELRHLLVFCVFSVSLYSQLTQVNLKMAVKAARENLRIFMQIHAEHFCQN